MNTPLRGILSARWRWATIIALLSTFFLSHAAWAAENPSLTVSVSDNTDTALSGDEITYTIKVENSSASDISTDIVFSLPANVTYEYALPVVSSSSPNVTWSGFNIPANSTLPFYVTVKVASNLADGTSLNASVAVNSNSGANTNSAIDTTTIKAAKMSVSDLAFGFVKVGLNSSRNITVTNLGAQPLVISALSALSAPFSVGNTCIGTSIASSSSCNIGVTFAPVASGLYTQTLTITSNDPANSHTHTVTITGQSGIVSLSASPTNIGFGNQAVGGTTAAQTFTLSNDGTETVDITNITFPASFVRQTSSSPSACPTTTSFTISGGASCVIAVAFAPTAAQAYSGAISIYNTATSRPIAISLTGTGVIIAPGVTLDRTSIDFGSVAYGVASGAQTVKLTNTGSADLSITGITPPSNTDFAVSNDCPATLAAGNFCTISVVFTPSAGGQRTGTISISTNASGSSPTIQLTGVGIAPKYSSSPAAGALNISSVIGSSNTVNIAISNAGSATLNVSAPSESVAAPFSVTPVTAYTVAVGATQQIAVTCAPSDAGPHTQTLTYTTNDPTLPSVAYTITCTGTATATAGFASSPAAGGTIAFGDVAAGSSVTSNLSISEVGTAALEIGLKGGSLATAITGAQASSFTVAGTFPMTIADGSAATALTLTCSPQAEGDLSAALTLTTNDPALPEVSYTLTCKGLGTVTYTMYMPLLTRAASAADLAVSQFTITPTSLKAGDPVQVTAVVANTGGTATGGFWVDLYLNPTTVPTAANLPWNETCGQQNPCYGLAWYVENLAPGASVTLTSDAGSYFAQNSNWVGTLAAGTTNAYLYVDSWNRDDQGGVRVDTGAVNESNESNNRADITGLSVSTSGLRLQTNDVKSIPSRPNHPAGF